MSYLGQYMGKRPSSSIPPRPKIVPHNIPGQGVPTYYEPVNNPAELKLQIQTVPVMELNNNNNDDYCIIL